MTDLVPVLNGAPIYWNADYTGIVIEDGFVPTWDQYSEMVWYSVNGTEAHRWMLIDTLMHANEKLGETAAQLETYIPYKRSTIQNWLWIGTHWPQGTRVPGVPVSFHQVVTPLLTKSDGGGEHNRKLAQVWLEDTRDLGWKRSDLEMQFRFDPLLPPSAANGRLPVPYLEDGSSPLEFDVATAGIGPDKLEEMLNKWLLWGNQHPEARELVVETRRMLKFYKDAVNDEG